MKFEFNCYGHENVLSNHKTTLEFTKDTHLTRRGDCIVAINADFDFKMLKQLVNSNPGATVEAIIECGNLSDRFSFQLNRDFVDKSEIVIRKSDFKSERTLGIHASKAAIDLNRDLVKRMALQESVLKVKFSIK